MFIYLRLDPEDVITGDRNTPVKSNFPPLIQSVWGDADLIEYVHPNGGVVTLREEFRHVD